MKLKYISWLPAAILMVVIFLFSSKTADLSQQSSLGISVVILKLYDQIQHVQMSGIEKLDLLAIIDHIVRKTAHFTEYAFLSAALAFHFTIWKKSKLYKTFLPVILAGLYAATDEFHQTFVAGRSGQITDVLLDTTGAAVGAFLFHILMLLIKHIRHRRADAIGPV